MAGRIFITGDKHGAIFLLSRFAEMQQIDETDILLLAGDAGYVWDADYPYAVETVMQTFPGILAFIDGNHENHAILNGLEETRWNGGRVHKIAERMFHLMRGEVYSIYGKTFFTLGGARSSDKDRRTEGVSWWKEEEPNKDEIAHAEGMLKKHKDEIAYVITHETPLFARAAIKRKKPIDADDTLPVLLEGWYKQMEHAPAFQKWYFGHMHVDQEITGKLQAVHNAFLQIL